MCSAYTDCHQCDLCKGQQSWIGGLGRARCDDIGDLNGDVMISSCLWHEGFIQWGLRILLVVVEVVPGRWMWLSTPVWSYSLVSKICCRLHAREISNDQPFPESITVSVEPSFTSISYFNDIILISKCHSVIFQIRSMVGVPSLTVQQYPIDLSSRQCIMITKFPGGYFILLRNLQVHWLCVTTLGIWITWRSLV